METLVPENSRISQATARLELARVLIQLRRLKEAEREIAIVAKSSPKDPEILATWADIAALQGHAKQARDLYEQATAAGKNNKLKLRYAIQRQTWGDFYSAEKDLNEYLSHNSENQDALLSLASLYQGAQRYDDAEQIYRSLLNKNPNLPQALLGLATIRYLQKDFSGVKQFTTRVFQPHSLENQALLLQAKADLALGLDEQAAQAYRGLINRDKKNTEAWIGLAQVYFKQGEDKLAQKAMDSALAMDSQCVEASIVLASKNFIDPNWFIEKKQLIQGNPILLTQWGNALALKGHNFDALAFLDEAIKEDPNYFPARVARAELLATCLRYGEALTELDTLIKELPETSKLQLTKARILGWSKQYQASLDAYNHLQNQNLGDPIVREERARVAAWSKNMKEAQRIYAEAWIHPVNQKISDAARKRGLIIPVNSKREQTPFHTYEKICALRDAGKLSNPEAWEQILNTHFAAYRIQKLAWEEAKAKRLAWDGRNARAEDAYQVLLTSRPGNEEALFDLAQVQASSGLHQRATATYKKLLAIDPLHDRASRALERQNIKARPLIKGDYYYWNEDGRGGTSDIVRHRWRAFGEISLNRQIYITAGPSIWLELPGENHVPYTATGGFIEMRGVANEYLSFSASLGGRSFGSQGPPGTLTGHAAITANFYDYLSINVTYMRIDETHNLFALWQGTQSNNLEIAVASRITRSIAIEGHWLNQWYNDGNRGVALWILPSLLILDHPHTLKLGFRTEYRNVENESLFIYNGTQLDNIIYPYWTPQNYVRGQVTLEWRHDLSQEFFIESEQRYYSLRVAAGTDSTDNPSIAIEGEIHWEFAQRWGVSARGYFEYGTKWSGSALFLQASCRL